MRLVLFLLFAVTGIARATEVADPNSTEPTFATPAPKVDIQQCMHAPSGADAALKNSDFTEVPPNQIQMPGLGGNLKDLISATSKGLEKCKSQNLYQPVTLGSVTLSRMQWCVQTNTKILELAKAAEAKWWLPESYKYKSFINAAKKQFHWYKSGCNEKNMFTGYYYASLQAKLHP